MILSDNRSLCIRYRAFFNTELPTEQSTHSAVALVAVVALLLAEAVGVNFYYIAVAVVLTFTSSSNSRWLWVLTGPLSAQPPISFSNCHQMSLS